MSKDRALTRRAFMTPYCKLSQYTESGDYPMVVDAAFATTPEPVERIFAILAGYRGRILGTDCRYGCPLGRGELEIDALAT